MSYVPMSTIFLCIVYNLKQQPSNVAIILTEHPSFFAYDCTVTVTERKAKRDGVPKLPLIDLVTKNSGGKGKTQLRQNSSTERKRRTRFVASQISFSNLHSHFIDLHFINSSLASFLLFPFRSSTSKFSVVILRFLKRKLQSRSLSGFRPWIGLYKWICLLHTTM